MRARRYTAYAQFLDLATTETDDCVLWPFASDGAGYGQVRHGGVRYKTHRLSCELAHGAPFEGAHAAHSCHTPACINPRHLRWATRSANEQDKVLDGTSNRGSANGASRLTEFDVRAIRHYASCGTMQKVLSEHFNVGAMAISNIVNRKTWGWLA